ncbi:hypothetical protein KZJ38_29535 [Paraburkholderia edwinii]|uniref:Uncharacterized protein n=1 Tax=Paraburkholderia edwinii TaxID=2861782 RepID=A0ABX8UQC2_9BURK|nr:hypothetical protein [Paraburkholderia edwinii]QYD71192.1 hypothetical protein KZJ38_29535 [Paraburkholderia edwinii]
MKFVPGNSTAAGQSEPLRRFAAWLREAVVAHLIRTCCTLTLERPLLEIQGCGTSLEMDDLSFCAGLNFENALENVLETHAKARLKGH